jgi:hypothetical protein
MHKNVIPIYKYQKTHNSETFRLIKRFLHILLVFLSPNVMMLYIRVSVVLTRHYCRKEREKLYINLDSAVLWECHLGNQ